MAQNLTTIEIAESIEDCTVIGLLRSGRVAETYHVRYESTDYCLRVLKTELLNDRNSILQFRNEHKALSEIRHPGFLGANGWGEFEGCPYYFTEFIVHDSLRDLIEKGIGHDFKKNILLQVVAACAYLHERNMVHFGVKPENVLYSNGQIKLIQMGQVRLFDEHMEYPDLLGTEGFTEPSVMAGSSEVSKRSDVYSVSALGVYIWHDGQKTTQASIATAPFGKALLQGLEGKLFDCSQMLSLMVDPTTPATPTTPSRSNSTHKSHKKFRLASVIIVLIALLSIYLAWPHIVRQFDSASKHGSTQLHSVDKAHLAEFDLQKPLPPLPHIPNDSHNTEFWNFIDTFNKIPEGATPQAVAVYKTQGTAERFNFKVIAKKSVVGNMAGITEHYKILYHSDRTHAIPGSFSESYQAMLSQCWHILGKLSGEVDTSNYVEEFSSWVRVCDYLAKNGSLSDKKFALRLARKMYSTAMFNVSKIDELDQSVIYKAVGDLYIPLMDTFRDEVSDLDLRYVSSVLKSGSGKDPYANFLKWALRNNFELYKDPVNFDLYHTLVIESNNLFVDMGLYEYAVYWVHCCYGKILLGAPFDQAINQNFKLKIKQNNLLDKYNKLRNI